MITTNSVPTEWRRILHAIFVVHPEAVLAGGALRDLDNGVTPKDLDIFIERSSNVLFADPILMALRTVNPNAQALRSYDFNSMGLETDCIVSRAYIVNGLEVNVIQLKDRVNITRVLDRIDFGICQIAYAIDGGVRWSNAYAKDRADKTFTITRNDSMEDRNRTYRRWKRLSKKYPGWRLVDPFHDKVESARGALLNWIGEMALDAALFLKRYLPRGIAR